MLRVSHPDATLLDVVVDHCPGVKVVSLCLEDKAGFGVGRMAGSASAGWQEEGLFHRTKLAIISRAWEAAVTNAEASTPPSREGTRRENHERSLYPARLVAW